MEKSNSTSFNASVGGIVYLFKRSQQYLAKVVHHDYKDVSAPLSLVKNARSLIIHLLASSVDDKDYDLIINVSGALNAIYRDVESMLRVVAPWGEGCDVKAISFTS
jgi:hypothetical protein